MSNACGLGCCRPKSTLANHRYSLCRRLGALEGEHGMGHDERARAWKIEVLSRVVDGSMSAATAASVLAVSTRHIRRMIKRFREDGAAALRHGLRGRPSNNQIRTGLREEVTQLVRDRYADFGPTLAAECLAKAHGLVS